MALLATPAPWPARRGHAPLALVVSDTVARRVVASRRALAPGRASTARRGPRASSRLPRTRRRLARRRGPARTLNSSRLAPAPSLRRRRRLRGTPARPSAGIPPPPPRSPPHPGSRRLARVVGSVGIITLAQASASSARSASRPSAPARSPTRTPRAWCPRSSSSPSEDSTDPPRRPDRRSRGRATTSLGGREARSHRRKGSTRRNRRPADDRGDPARRLPPASAVVTGRDVACACPPPRDLRARRRVVTPPRRASTRHALRAAAQLRVMAPCPPRGGERRADGANDRRGGGPRPRRRLRRRRRRGRHRVVHRRRAQYEYRRGRDGTGREPRPPPRRSLGAPRTAALRLFASREANRSAGGSGRERAGARASFGAGRHARVGSAPRGPRSCRPRRARTRSSRRSRPPPPPGWGTPRFAATPLGILSAALLTPSCRDSPPPPPPAAADAADADARTCGDEEEPSPPSRRRRSVRRPGPDDARGRHRDAARGDAVALLFQRDAFDEGAGGALAAEVSLLLLLAGSSRARDVLQRAHYVGLGDATPPSRRALLFVNAAMNAALTIWPGRLGVRGIAISTAAGACRWLRPGRAPGDEERDDDGPERARDGTPADQAPRIIPADRRREERLRGAAKVANWSPERELRGDLGGATPAGARATSLAGAAATSVLSRGSRRRR